MLAFRAQDELEALVGCVGRALLWTFQRIQPEPLTPREREMRAEKPTSGELIMKHTLSSDKENHVLARKTMLLDEKVVFFLGFGTDFGL